MSKPCILCCAITGSVPTEADTPEVPISVSEGIQINHAAVEAGASTIHAHVRHADDTPTSHPEKFAALKEGLNKPCPSVVIQFSADGRPGAGRAHSGSVLQIRQAGRHPGANLRNSRPEAHLKDSKT